LGQIPVGAATNEHKAALKMLDLIPLDGKVVVGDAAFCQRDLSLEIVRRGGDWVWPVKDNQRELKAAIALAFDDFDLSPSGAAAGRG
jgi:predicted transposase YbfD/YdcC